MIEEPKPKSPSPHSAAKTAGIPLNPPQKIEDKDSPEYKKKVALGTLPILETTDNAANYGMKESLFTSLKDLFEAIVASQERMGIVRPYHFLELLRRQHEMFKTAMHQDAHEFLNILLNEVVANIESDATRASIEAERQSDSEGAETTTTLTTTNVSKSPSSLRWVHELFEGTLASETQCLTCEQVSRRDEVFLDLSVDLEQHSSVTSCLRKFSEEEMLCGRNKFHCDNCGGLQEAEKRMKIKRLPRILALHLKRFKYTDDLQRLQKLFHRVVYPYHLRLFNTTDDADDPDRLYELYAVVVHIGGGPYHGHYVAIIKTQDKGWLLFDDEMVEPVDKSYVRNFFGDRPGLACAYVLFYQETTVEAMEAELEKEGMPPADGVSELTLPAHTANGDLYRVNSSDPPSNDTPLKPVPSAPQMSPSAETALPVLPVSPLSPTPKSSPFSGMLSSKKSDVHARKEKAKEEKERRAAEKERERLEKVRRKEQELRYKQDIRRETENMRAAIQASKQSHKEEAAKRATSSDLPQVNGSTGHGHNHGHSISHGLGRFKLGSRSFSHSKTQSKGKEKEKENGQNRIPEVPPLPEAVQEIANKHMMPDPTPLPLNDYTDPINSRKQPPSPTKKEIPKVVERPGFKQATSKRSRFSLRNRSLSFM